MGSVNDSVETVNAAAAAIVTADSRVQPVSPQKRRWPGCWSLYWCFGSLKTNKRISHAALVPEPVATERTVALADNPIPITVPIPSTSIVQPFIAPPSSPMLQSDPPTAIHSPGGLLTLTSLSVNAISSDGQAHIFTIGPYAHETQLVSPPVFSAFTTEPSTAPVTPPPESVQLTTPSSPEVPFAQLLTSSLHRSRRNSGSKLALYEVHHLISPGSANSASGTSSPYLDKRPILEFRMIDASKLFDSKKFGHRKWGSRLGSGSVTPDGVGLASYDVVPVENEVSEVPSLASSRTGQLMGEGVVDHRVSFELSHEDAQAITEEMKQEVADKDHKKIDQSAAVKDLFTQENEICSEFCAEGLLNETAADEKKDCERDRSSYSLGSVKEFNFDSREREIPTSSPLGSEWWADEKVGEDAGDENNWTFFPLLQPGVS